MLCDIVLANTYSADPEDNLRLSERGAWRKLSRFSGFGVWPKENLVMGFFKMEIMGRIGEHGLKSVNHEFGSDICDVNLPFKDRVETMRVRKFLSTNVVNLKGMVKISAIEMEYQIQRYEN